MQQPAVHEAPIRAGWVRPVHCAGCTSAGTRTSTGVRGHASKVGLEALGKWAYGPDSELG
eukprot:12159476-Alexandrium_andersonii.AAC.1